MEFVLFERANEVVDSAKLVSKTRSSGLLSLDTTLRALRVYSYIYWRRNVSTEPLPSNDNVETYTDTRTDARAGISYQTVGYG
jgi:hypothetical protein